MKKIALTTAIIICVGLFATSSLGAQSIEQANASYEHFNILRQERGREAEAYSALYQCYKEHVALVEASAPTSPEFAQAKRTMREIYLFLQNGAAYHSSRGNQQNALLLAQAFMDIPLMEAFRGEVFVRDDYFPTMAYFAASGTFNAGDYDKAINYFRVYLDTGDQEKRQDVYSYMAKACMNIKNYDLAMDVLNEGSNNYPNDFNMLSMAINSCIEREDNANLQLFVTKAMAVKPNDETLLNIQGKLYEDTGEYQKALNIYNKLRQAKPNSLNIAQHIALNYYNLGVMFYNGASMEQDEATAKKYSRQSMDYFEAAASTLQDIIANDPTSVKYMQALATAYSCLGEQERLDDINAKLSAMGGQRVESGVMPVMITFSGRTVTQVSSGATTTLASAGSSVAGGSNAPKPAYSPNEAPLYSSFAKEFVESQIRRWQTKDPYETVEEYQTRVTEQTRAAKVEELKKVAESDYIKTYTQRIRFNDMLLKPYDADNRVFLVESQYGELIVPVPRDNNEAKVFESSWSGMQFKNPEFYINNDKLTLASLTFVTPAGKSYRYDGDKNLNYVETVVDVSFDPIDLFAQQTPSQQDTRVGRQTIRVGSAPASSDVDLNIPETNDINEKTFAVIISNENYSEVSNVVMALNDGETFSQYCKKTLGLPENNVRLYQDASYGVMIRAMRDIRDIAAAYAGDIKVIFYYAGHGIPNEATKDAFLLPVDADGTQTEGCYSLNRLYSELGALDARSVVVFLDACFSGANRDGQMLASARGVALKAKAEAPKGNMVIFSAASDDETAFPYHEKGHGLFTYFLLKKLQESEGNATLRELGDYITQNVKQQSVVVNRKVQTPTVTPAASLLDDWHKMTLLD
jgi:tetratricopeptide (TPR) repeat protein